MEPNFFMHIPLLSVVIPMAIGCIYPLIHNGKACRWLHLLTLGVVIIMSGLLLNFLRTVPGGMFTYSAGRFPAPWGNELRAGNLETVLALCFAVVMFLSVWGGNENTYNKIKPQKAYIQYVMLNFLLASTMALVYTNDLFTTYVFIEINTIAACAIMLIDNDGASYGAAMKYMFMSMLGSGLYLVAIIYIYSVTGHLLMVPIHEQIVILLQTGQYHVPLVVAFAMFGLAISTKAGLFPFHAWFPDSYNYSPHSSSAMLSGIVSKVYIFVFLKIIFRVFGVEAFEAWHLQTIFLVLGCTAMIMGSVYAMMQKDLKKIVAFSSVAQIGYIFMAIGLNTFLGYAAAIFHMIFHALTKSMLFVATGNIVDKAGSSKLEDLHGMAYKTPVSVLAFCAGGMSFIGVPFFMGFISKINLASAGYQAGNYIVLIVLVISTCLNVLYYIPTMTQFFGKTNVSAERLKPEGEKLNTALPLIIFMAINVYLSLFQGPWMHLIESGIKTLG